MKIYRATKIYAVSMLVIALVISVYVTRQISYPYLTRIISLFLLNAVIAAIGSAFYQWGGEKDHINIKKSSIVEDALFAYVISYGVSAFLFKGANNAFVAFVIGVCALSFFRGRCHHKLHTNDHETIKRIGKM